MAVHSHDFVENYQGFVGYGFDRATDEKTIIYYLQKFSDDHLMNILVKKLSDADIEKIFELVNYILKKYLSENEYHALFLKDDHDDHI